MKFFHDDDEDDECLFITNVTRFIPLFSCIISVDLEIIPPDSSLHCVLKFLCKFLILLRIGEMAGACGFLFINYY